MATTGLDAMHPMLRNRDIQLISAMLVLWRSGVEEGHLFALQDVKAGMRSDVF